METKHIIASTQVGDWKVAIEEVVDNNTATVFDRTFLCTKTDTVGVPIVEYFDSLIDTVEFARSFSNSTTPSRWYIVSRLCRDADEYYQTRGIDL